MYEFTHKGLWFKWALLDRPSKWLAGLSFAAVTTALVPAVIVFSDASYKLGYAAHSGGRADMMVAGFKPWMAWWLIGFSLASGILWWRFSLRQDEMFNRVQNWAISMASGWTAVVFAGWSVLAFSGAVAWTGPLIFFLTFYVAIIAFWLIAARRWA